MNIYHYGDEIQIEALILDASLQPLTEKTDILVSIRRLSDDLFLDWDDGQFKSSGWTTRQIALSEVDSSLAPGSYFVELDTTELQISGIGGFYSVDITQSPGTDAGNVPQKGTFEIIAPRR